MGNLCSLYLEAPRSFWIKLICYTRLGIRDPETKNCYPDCFSFYQGGWAIACILPYTIPMSNASCMLKNLSICIRYCRVEWEWFSVYRCLRFLLDQLVLCCIRWSTIAQQCWRCFLEVIEKLRIGLICDFLVKDSTFSERKCKKVLGCKLWQCGCKRNCHIRL